MKSFSRRFFGHLARSAPEADHHRVIAAALRPPTDWRKPIGHRRTAWLRTIDEDVQPQNFGVHTAWRKARDRDIWQQVGSMAIGNALLGVRHQNKRLNEGNLHFALNGVLS